MTTQPVDAIVTGMAVETCLGRDLTTFWTNLCEGRSGIRTISGFDASSLACQIAGEVDLDVTDVMTGTEIRRTSRLQRLTYSAVSGAVHHAKLETAPIGDRVALVLGTGAGELPYMEEYLGHTTGSVRDRMMIQRALPNMATAFSAIKLGIRGPSLVVSTACASSTDATGYGLSLLRAGVVDVAIVAGAEALISPSGIRGLMAVGALATNSNDDAPTASRPFDAERSGMVPSEGAGAIVLESRQHAEARGASAFATLRGYASTSDAYHLFAPSENGTPAVEAMVRALTDAGVHADEIDHVNLHGTSTPLNDIAETRVMKAVLGPRVHDVPMTAPKSVIGHMNGACGIVEAVATILTIVNGWVPPTVNLTHPDPECDLDYTALTGRAADVRTAVTCNFGFGGQNAALVFQRDD